MKTGRDLLLGLFDAAVAAADPGLAVLTALKANGPPRTAPHIIAVGKAAPAMAAAALSALAAHGLEPAGGIVVAAGGGDGRLGRLPLIRGDHPVPGPRSFAAADAVGRAAAAVTDADECWVLLSGGTSSLIGAPLPGIEPERLVQLFEDLLGSGRPIGEVNAVRRRSLRWGAGRLAAALAARRIRVLAMSDVPGDRPGDIGSGPCSREPGELPDSRVSFEIVARNADAIAGAARCARKHGLEVVPGEPLVGEARDAGDALARDLLALRNEVPTGRSACILRGGETTVTLGASPGAGGRSQELALAAARGLAGRPLVAVLAAGTDGRDGPTDAAGAVVDGATWTRAETAGVDPAAALAGHDAYRALDAAGALLRTGPTGTNVMDLAIGLVEGS